MEPAGGVVVRAPDSHVTVHGLSPEPGGLEITLGVCACAHISKIPRDEWRRRDVLPGGMISHFSLGIIIFSTLKCSKRAPLGNGLI